MKKRVIAAVIFILLFLFVIYAVKFIDVAAIGPENTSIGLSRLNETVHDFTGVNMLWYDITGYIGYASLVIAAVFMLAALIQLIRGRSLLNVDGELYVLACLYIITAGLYFLFEVYIINYRPVLMPGSASPEASFPSSHTMLAFVIFGSTFLLLRKYVKNRALRFFLRLICVLVILVTVGGRLYSGVHWLTDIIGGVCISLALLCLFGGILYRFRSAYVPTHYRSSHQSDE